MKLIKRIKRIVRAVVRVDRATGKARDRAIRWVRAHLRRGKPVKGHRRVIGGTKGRYAAKRRKIVTVARQGTYRRNAQAGTRRKRA